MERQFIFTNKIKYFEIEEKGKKRFFIKGDYSTTDLDLVNDICTKNCQESMTSQMKSGRIKLDLEHEAFRGQTNEEKEINKTRIPLAKAIDAKTIGESSEATWELNPDYKKFDAKGNVVYTFNEVKSNIENGMYDAFSIAYIPTKVAQKDVNGNNVRMLDDVRLLNVALTGNPVNTAAQIKQVFMKSLDAMDEYKEEVKNNPDVADLLEVKASPQERRTQARNEAIAESGDDGDEDEEETKKYKKEKKTYEKDGGHAHTENEPLGLHNHQEIEERISDLRDSINFLHERIDGLNNPKENGQVEEVSVLAQKSQSSEKDIHIIEKEVKKMSNEDGKEEGAQESAKVESNESQESQPSKEESKPLEEVKDLLKKYSERIDSIEKQLKDLLEVKAIERKANSKVLNENVDVKDMSEVKSRRAGLSELK